MPTIYKYVQFETSLVKWASPVSYQGDQGACGPNMIYNAIGLISNLYGNHFEVNKQIVYNMYLKNYDLLGADAGVNPQLFENTLETLGVTESKEIDYGINHISELPSNIAYTDAATHTLVLDKVRHDGYNEESLSQVLAHKLLEGKPLLLYFTIMGDFMQQDGPLSGQTGANFAPYAGGHAVSITAVDTANNMLTVASWGEQYGDKGYFHLSLDSFYAHKGGSSLNLWDVYEINGFNGVNLDFNNRTESVASAFVAILDRAPANGGLTAYSNLMSQGNTLENVCDYILKTAEAQTLYGGKSNEQFVQSLFNNVLGRDAAAGGLNFYMSQLAAGTAKSFVAADIITNGLDKAHWSNGLYFGDSLQRYDEGLLFQNRTLAAQNYAITLQAQGGHNDVAAELLNEVTSDPGSIWGVALVGVREQLGYEHIDGAVLS
jgi:hypothetical protein